LSARVIAGAVVLECFEGGDDLFQVGLDAAQVLGESELSAGVGLGDQVAVGGGLPPVDLQELGGCLEVRAGQAGVGVVADRLTGDVDPLGLVAVECCRPGPACRA
jgi:hypothetical protein